jgi:uncharacterized Zn finger protein
MLILKDGQPFVHNLDDILTIECCNCGHIHRMDMEILNSKQIMFTLTQVKKTEPDKET